ncbi:MAG: hypothetical protein PVJ28_00105 [Acidimicrobiia bacterium]|jgi:hypothetical protein
MAKTSGLGSTVTVDDSGGTGRDISTDVTEFNFATPKAVTDITGVDSSAMERLALLSDFSLSLKGKFDPGSNLAHDVFNDIQGGVSRTVVIATGGATMTAECLLTDYQLARSGAGSLDWTVPGVLSDGVAPAWT